MLHHTPLKTGLPQKTQKIIFPQFFIHPSPVKSFIEHADDSEISQQMRLSLTPKHSLSGHFAMGLFFPISRVCYSCLFNSFLSFYPRYSFRSKASKPEKPPLFFSPFVRGRRSSMFCKFCTFPRSRSVSFYSFVWMRSFICFRCSSVFHSFSPLPPARYHLALHPARPLSSYALFSSTLFSFFSFPDLSGQAVSMSVIRGCFLFFRRPLRLGGEANFSG